MVMVSSGTDIRESENAKCKSRQRPGRQKEAEPFETLTKVVGCRDVLKEATARDLIARAGLGVLSQLNQTVVRVNIDIQTVEEKKSA
jgi:hypothetical protein